MKRYLIKLFYFLIPLYLFVALIVVVDPYEFINVFHVIGPDDKLEVIKRSDEASPRGGMLWKMIHFNRMPKKKVIIGDSQSLNINESLVKELTGDDYYNFSIPGSSYNTIFETFWHVTKQVKLETVYFQLGFMNYNANRDYNLFHFGQDYIDNPYLYFTTKEIFYDCLYNIFYATVRDPNMEQKSTEIFDIERQNEVSKKSLKLFFSNYEYPEYFQSELSRIAEYCNANDIEIRFIIFPVYKGVHDYLALNSLEEMNTKFKDNLKSLAYTYDLETVSEYEEKRNNFTDYFHPKKRTVDALTRQIWGDESSINRNN